MIARKLAAAVLAWVVWGQPSHAAEPADVELVSIQSRATLVLGGSPVTRRFEAPFSTSLDRDGLGSVTVQSSTSTGGGLSATAVARSGRAMADFDSTQIFRFADTSSPQWVTFAHSVEASVQLPSSSGAGSLSYGLTLFAPDGRTLLRELWSDQANGATANWFMDLGPISFLAEPGIYRLEVEGVAISDAPVGGGSARASLSSYLTFTATPVPESSMWVLLLAGLGVVGVAARWRRPGVMRPALMSRRSPQTHRADALRLQIGPDFCEQPPEDCPTSAGGTSPRRGSKLLVGQCTHETCLRHTSGLSGPGHRDGSRLGDPEPLACRRSSDWIIGWRLRYSNSRSFCADVMPASAIIWGQAS